jgi:hypothetical protein
MKNPGDRAGFCCSRGIVAGSLVTAEQVHGSHVAVVDGASRGARIPACDGLATNERGLPLGIMTADCLPVFLTDTGTKAVAIVHAGWRGIAGGIIGSALSVLKDRFALEPKDLIASVGPHIGACCYHVGDDVAEALGLPQGTEGCDLGGCVTRDLERAGVRRISVCSLCTSCTVDQFFSYRRDKTPARMMSFIQR